MTLPELLSVAPGADLTVVNEPFHCAGKLVLTLEGGESRSWLFSEEGELLAVAPGDDEAMFFRPTGEEIDASGDQVLFQGKDYESTYEDGGKISQVQGDVVGMADDRLAFSEYEADDGGRVRVIRNENTGETRSYVGEVVVVEEIMSVS
ncbi:hypothetical protein HYV73_04400 [Candidatus Uhrbacteria bacterium]|nr:hypothetical protein [Candidatus Uhrbacteria bacterium]